MEAILLLCGAGGPQLKRNLLDGGPSMRSRPSSLIPIAATLAFIGCGLFDHSFAITGMVHFNTVEGGCWLIRAEDGHFFEPTNLPTEFRQDSLRIRATLETRHDLMSFCQIGEIVDILHIERR